MSFLQNKAYIFMYLILFIVCILLDNFHSNNFIHLNNIFLFDNKVAAKIGKEAFLDPEILICPLSLAAPKTSNFFMIILFKVFYCYLMIFGLKVRRGNWKRSE